MWSTQIHSFLLDLRTETSDAAHSVASSKMSFAFWGKEFSLYHLAVAVALIYRRKVSGVPHVRSALVLYVS